MANKSLFALMPFCSYALSPSIRYTQYEIRKITYEIINKNMQNKANFPDTQMNVSRVSTKDYESQTLGERGKNKPNSNPIQTRTKPISEKAKMNVTSIITKGYENKPRFRAKAKQTQFKPKQTQSNPISKANKLCCSDV